MSDVRRVAAGILLRLDERRSTLAAELDEARKQIADRRDRGLLVEIATGALRWRQELDALIEHASRRPVSSIEPAALAVLRLGAYQLRHLDRVPPHAVVDESVEAVRALGSPRAAGFVNAVLRRLTEPAAARSLPRRPAEDAPLDTWTRYLSITLSHPAWLVARWLKRHGPDAAERWCRFNNSPPDVTIRPLGTLSASALVDRLRSAGIEATPATLVSDAIVLPPGALGRVPPDVLATVHIQDEGSQLVARFAGARPGERVLDLCAAPGGKTLVLATDLDLGAGDNGSLLVSGDRRRARVALLAATVRRATLGAAVVALDACGPLPFHDTFDLVVVDAPCSGLGTLRRDPDLKWHRAEADLTRFAGDQQRMLAAAAGVVRPGGRLVYATCSSEPEENIDVVRAFLGTHAGFSLDAHPPAAVEGRLVDADGCLATTPFRDDLDAYFAARLVRRDSA